MSEGYFGKREKLYLDDLHSALVSAHHILHYHSVVDGYGHISVRNPDNPAESFLLPQNIAPALLSSSDEFVEYKIDDGEPIEKDETRQHFSERYIHSELYKKFPDVNCVVHSHCTDVLPYTVGSVPLKSMTHMTGFLGLLRLLSIPSLLWANRLTSPRFIYADMGHHFRLLLPQLSCLQSHPSSLPRCHFQACHQLLVHLLQDALCPTLLPRRSGP